MNRILLFQVLYFSTLICYIIFSMSTSKDRLERLAYHCFLKFSSSYTYPQIQQKVYSSFVRTLNAHTKNQSSPFSMQQILLQSKLTNKWIKKEVKNLDRQQQRGKKQLTKGKKGRKSLRQIEEQKQRNQIKNQQQGLKLKKQEVMEEERMFSIQQIEIENEEKDELEYKMSFGMNINALDNSFIPFPEWVDWTVVSEENHLPF